MHFSYYFHAFAIIVLASCVISSRAGTAPLRTDVSIIEKYIILGQDPTTKNILQIPMLAFTHNQEEQDSERTWYGVIASGEQLFMVIIKQGNQQIMPLESVLNVPDTEKSSVSAAKILDCSMTDPRKGYVYDTTKTFDIEVSLSQEVKFFKTFSLLLIQRDLSTLKALAEKYSINRIESIVEKAFDAIGLMRIEWASKAELHEILSGKKSAPQRLLGKLIFVTREEAALMAQALLLEQLKNQSPEEAAAFARELGIAEENCVVA